MKELLQYALEAIVSTGILYGCYRLLLDRRVGYGLCRLYLFAALVVGSLIPLFDIPVWPGRIVEVAPLPEQPLPLLPTRFEAPVPQPIDDRTIVWALYALGAFVLLALMTRQAVQIARLHRGALVSHHARYRLVRTLRQISSFSFLRSIYLWQQTPEEELSVDAQSELTAVCAAIGKILQNGERAERFAELCAQSKAVFFLGRGIDYAVAVEASLKLKEVSYVFSDGYPAGELKHGTLALVDENTLSVFVICDEALAEKCLNAVSQVASRKGRAAVITCVEGVAEKLGDTAEVWEIPACPVLLSPFLSAVALQLVAYRTAVILGRDPDKPRNLAKSVTVE